MIKHRRLLSIVVSICLAASMMPAVAFGAVTGSQTASSDAQSDTQAEEFEPTQMDDDGTLNISESNDSQISTLSSDGQLVVCLDPGHRDSTNDYGATANGLKEAELALTIALAAKAELEKYNVKVVMTRSSNSETIGLTERVNKAIEASADVFVSFHINATANATGYEVWVQRPNCTYRPELNVESTALANKVLNNLSFTGIKNRGVKYSTSDSTKYPDNSMADKLSVLRNSRIANIPAILIEHAFINGKESDVNLLKSTESLQAMGVADAQAIVEQYGLQLKSETTNGEDVTGGQDSNSEADNAGETVTETALDATPAAITYPTSTSNETFNFTDATASSTWAYDYIQKVANYGLMQGSNNTFNTNGTLTRADAALIIFRAQTGYTYTESTKLKTAKANTFSDVPDNQYYTQAVNWVYENGIMTGNTVNGKVEWRPNDSITRQELATIVWRVAGEPTASNKAAYNAASDTAAVASWAQNALAWTAEKDILSGKTTATGKLLDPTATATRAEAAKIFVNAYDYISGVTILGSSTKTVAQMVARYNKTGHTYPTELAQYGAANITQFCQILLEEAQAEGVRAEVVFAQAMKETGWLQSSRAKTQCNFCGLGATSNSVAGANFVSFEVDGKTCTYGSNAVRAGLRAQVQHLKAYATTIAPRTTVIDPRYGLVSKGVSPNVEGLGGRWATSVTYGVSIVQMINEIK